MAKDPAEILSAMLAMFETGDTSNVASVVSSEYVDHQGVGGGEIRGSDGFAAVVEVARGGLAALEATAKEVISDENGVAARVHWVATLESGFRVSRHTYEIVHVRDGLAFEHWGAGDQWLPEHVPQPPDEGAAAEPQPADDIEGQPVGPEEIDSILVPDDRPRVLTFVFGLPVQLPFPHVSTVAQHLALGEITDRKWDFESHIQMGEGWSDKPLSMRLPFVSLKFWQPKVVKRYDFGEAGIARVMREIWGGPEVTEEIESPSDAPVESYRTVVEAVTQAVAVEGEASAPNLVSTCFQRCLTVLNNVVDAYSTAFDDIEMPHFSASHLGMLAFAGSRPLDGKYDVGPVMYLLPSAPPPHADKPIVEGDDWDKLMFSFQAVVQGNPFISAKRYFTQGVRALYSGDHAQALVLFATSGEISLNALLRSVVVETQGAAAAQAIFHSPDRRSGLTARLRGEYARRLGGANWNPEVAIGEVAEWWRVVQVVRGRIVHGGYQPNPQEAYDAMVATQDLDRFINDRLADRRFDCPATALSKLGAGGLQERGHWSDRMQRKAAATDVFGHWGRVRETIVDSADEDAE